MDSSPADPQRPGARKPRPAWLFRQASAIPFWVVAGELQVVLVTSRHKRKWIVPKGVVDLGLSPEQAALREAHEEAGVIGGIEGAAVGRYEFAKWGGTCAVEGTADDARRGAAHNGRLLLAAFPGAQRGIRSDES